MFCSRMSLQKVVEVWVSWKLDYFDDLDILSVCLVLEWYFTKHENGIVINYGYGLQVEVRDSCSTT